MNIDYSLYIEASAQRVFQRISDISALSEWVGFIVETSLPPSANVAAGTQFSEVSLLLGQEIRSEKVVTEFEPVHRFAVRSLSGPIEHALRFQIEPQGRGVVLHICVEGELEGPLGLFPGLVVNTIRNQVAADLDRLKRALECESADAS